MNNTDLYDIKNLSIKYGGIRNYTSTSYCRKFTNKDYGNCLYTDEDGKAVIFDDKGKGLITKMFFPDINEKAVLEFYFDDEKVPSVRDSIENIFCGKNSNFPKESVFITNPYRLKNKASGYISYIAVSYEKRLVIKLVTDDSYYYYHIDYCKFACDHKTESALQFHGIGRGEYGGKKEKREFREITIPAYKSKKAAVIFNERGLIKTVRLKIPALKLKKKKSRLLFRHGFSQRKSNKLLSKLFVLIDVCGEETVNVPLAHFFGYSTFGRDKNAARYVTNSELFGFDGEYLYFDAPMPFRKEFGFTIVNTSDVSLENVSVQIEYYKDIPDIDRHMTLFATNTKSYADACNGKDMLFADVRGRGKYIAAVADMDSGISIDKSDYPEGDEHIYFDNAPSPQINGTGTEDYYNGAYYWYYGALSRPAFGCTYNAKWYRRRKSRTDKTYKSGAYRIHIQDAYNFENRFVFRMEHGGENDAALSANVTLFYYLDKNPNESADLSATLLNPYRVCSRYEGEKNGPYIEKTLGMLKKNGKIEIDLPQNARMISRSTDYSFLNQEAEIYIDGEYAGVWYDAGSNPYYRLKSSEFLIPVSGNEKKTKKMTIVAKTDWTYGDMKIIEGK